jgi:DNA-binding transcriptional LysR family regulator
MKINLEVLIILDALDRQGSFAAAAAELYKTPPALSYMVQKLENDLNVVLLDRSGHRAKFTATGRLMLEKGRKLLRAAQSLEQQAHYVEKGWESELTIGLDALFPFELLLPLIKEFYRDHHLTRLRFSHEVLAGSWESLIQGCADIVIGAIAPPTTQSGYAFSPMGSLHYRFCISPDHPLAQAAEPLSADVIRQHRAVVVRDTSRINGPQNLHVLQEQDTLTVFDFQSKLQIQLAGLACGYLPDYLAAPYLASGKLVVKQVENKSNFNTAYLGWNESANGLAALWWREKLLSCDNWDSIYSTKAGDDSLTSAS